MKKLVLVAALTAGFSLSANANELSDYLDSQYEISWAQETVFEAVHSTGSIDPLAAYQTEGGQLEFGSEAGALGSVVDIAAMEVMGKRLSNKDRVLFVDTYE